jgi:hypothetical protein
MNKPLNVFFAKDQAITHTLGGLVRFAKVEGKIKW